jgi:hypothetical protein
MLASIFLMVMISILVLPSIFWLYALTDAAMNEFSTFGIKFAWLVLLVCFPPIATLFYFLLGRNQRKTHYKVGKAVIWLIFLIPLLAMIYIYFHFGADFSFQPEMPGSINI